MSGNNTSQSTTTVFVDDLDKNLVYLPVGAWERSGQGQGLTGGTFTFSTTENATVTMHSPQNTTGFAWRGFLRSGPALYSVCIDCTDPGAANLVDGHSWNQQSTNDITTLFTQTGLSNSAHTITITNLLDPRFGNVSQITADGFILVIENAPVVAPPSSSSSSSSVLPTSTSSSSQITSSTTDMAMSTSATVATSSSSSAPATTSHSSGTFASVSKKMPEGVTIGTACASVFGLLSLFVLMWWVVRKKHVYGKVSNGGYGSRLPVGDIESSISSTLRSTSSNKNPVVQVAFSSSGNPSRGFNQSPSNTLRSNGNQTSHPHSQNGSSSNGSSSNTSPSTLSRPSPLPQWGIIPFRLSPSPSAYPELGPPTNDTTRKSITLTAPGVISPRIPEDDDNNDADVDFDFTTPFPSSEIGTSSFTATGTGWETG